MKKTLTPKKIFSWSSLALASSLLVSVLVPTAQAATYSLPDAPTNVTSYLSARGVVVKWTPSPAITPAITGYVVSAGPGSCPIFVPASNNSVVSMPVVPGQPGGTPVVQAVNAYGFSKPAASKNSYTKEQLVTVSSSQNRAVQVLQLSDLHGAIEVGNSFGAALLASNWAADRAANVATVALSSGDNIGAAPPISTEFEELPTIESLNLAKLDVSILGNHEHDRNLDHFNKVIGASDFQWVVSNYNPDSLGAMKSGTKSVKNYTIIDRGGVKIGIVGSNTPETIEQVFPGITRMHLEPRRQLLSIQALQALTAQSRKQKTLVQKLLLLYFTKVGWKMPMAPLEATSISWLHRSRVLLQSMEATATRHMRQ